MVPRKETLVMAKRADALLLCSLDEEIAMSLL